MDDSSCRVEQGNNVNSGFLCCFMAHFRGEFITTHILEILPLSQSWRKCPKPPSSGTLKGCFSTGEELNVRGRQLPTPLCWRLRFGSTKSSDMEQEGAQHSLQLWNCCGTDRPSSQGRIPVISGTLQSERAQVCVPNFCRKNFPVIAQGEENA